MGFGDLLSLSIRLVQDRYAQLLPAVALLAGPLHLLSALVLTWLPGDADWEGTDRFGNTTLDVDGGDVVAFFGALGLGMVVSMVAGQLGTAAALRVVAGSYVDQPVTWREGVRFATRRIGPLIVLGLLTLVLTSLATLALVVPGIWAFAAWSVATPVLLLEDKQGMSALGRSWQLVRGRWWPVFGLLVVTAVVGGVVSSSISAMVSAPVDAATDADLAVDLVAALGSTLGTVLVAPFAAAVLVVVYVDLRVRREGFNRTVLAATVGAPPPAPIPTLPPPPPPPPLG